MSTNSVEVALDARTIIFIFTAAGVGVNILFLERVAEDRVKTSAAVKPVVMWVFCAFRLYFMMLIIIATLAAFIIALSAFVHKFAMDAALYWIIGLLLLSLGSLRVYKSTIEDAVDWGVIQSK